MKPPKIRLTRSRRLKLKSEPASDSDTGAKSSASVSQTTILPSTSRAVGPLPTSRWNINEPMPTVSNLQKQLPKESSAEPFKDPSRFQAVHFELFAPAAHTVFLAGSFNDWNPTATAMHRQSEAKWVKELLLPPGHYEYRFVVDGQWMEDPKAQGRVPNPYGGRNSLLRVG